MGDESDRVGQFSMGEECRSAADGPDGTQVRDRLAGLSVRDILARDPWSETHLVVDTVDAWSLRLDGRKAHR